MKYCIRFTLLLLVLFCAQSIHAQFSELDLKGTRGTTVGIVKNKMAVIDYGFKTPWHIQLKQSIVADELKQQYDQLQVSYAVDLKYVYAEMQLFGSTDWGLTYANCGARLNVSNKFFEDHLKLGVAFIPFYDSGMNYVSGWAVGASTKLYRDISLCVEYSREPEYRIAYKRAYIGFDINYKHLKVKPMLQIPCYDGGIRFDHSKVLVTATYTFNRKLEKESKN